MKSNLLIIVMPYLLFIWFMPHSLLNENYKVLDFEEVYISSDVDINELVKNALDDPILEELYKYHLDIFMSELKLRSKQEKMLSKEILEYTTSRDFQKSLDFNRYLDLSKKFNEEYKLDEMNTVSKDEFIKEVQMVHFERIINDVDVQKELKYNKQLAVFIKKTMLEKQVNSETLFTFSCYKCVYDYMSCLNPIPTSYTTSGSNPEIWTVLINGAAMYTQVFWFPDNTHSIQTTYTTDQCYTWYQNCLNACDRNWGS